MESFGQTMTLVQTYYRVASLTELDDEPAARRLRGVASLLDKSSGDASSCTTAPNNPPDLSETKIKKADALSISLDQLLII